MKDFELPEGWSYARLDQLKSADGIFVDGDWVESKDQDPNGNVRLIQLADIGDGYFKDKSNRFLTRAKADELSCTFLAQGDILISRLPDPLGRACIFPLTGKEKFVTVVDISIVRLGHALIESNYLQYLINSPVIRTKIEEYKTGSTRKRISRKNLGKIELPIPPLPEQHRIVEKIETLFSELDSGVESLKAAKAQLKRYRQSVLKSAFEGKLTAAWREAHADELESADNLLERIKAEREAAYEKKLDAWKEAVKAWEAKGKEGKKPARPKKSTELPPLSEDEHEKLNELPNRWGWVLLNHLCEVSGGMTKNSKRSTFKTKVPFLRVANVYANRLELDDIHYIGIKDDEFSRVALETNDLLFVEGNGSIDQIGRLAIWNGCIQNCIHQNHLIKARPSKNIDPKYILYFFMSKNGRDLIKEKANSTSGLFTLNLSKINNLPIPLLSLIEQHQIVNEIESRLSEADAMEKAIDESLQKAERLRQSILKKAFEGKLVPQDEDDEPALELLKRIHGVEVKDKVPFPVTVDGISTTDMHAGMIALTLDAHLNTPYEKTLNHVKHEKIAHLIEAIVGIDLGRDPVQDAAGPDDYPHLKKVEHRAKMKRWFNVKKEDIGHRYEASANFHALLTQTRNMAATRLEEIESLIHVMLPMDIERAEIFATTYAAWNNLLLDKKAPEDDEIVRMAREEWSSRKMTLERERFYRALDWMRKKGYVPVGRGKYVKPMKVKK